MMQEENIPQLIMSLKGVTTSWIVWNMHLLSFLNCLMLTQLSLKL